MNQGMLLVNKPVQAVWVKGHNENNPDAVGEVALTFTMPNGQTQNVAIDIMPWGMMICCENTPLGVNIDGGNYITVKLRCQNDSET